FDDITMGLSKSAVRGIAGSAAALSVMTAAPNTQAVIGPGDFCGAVSDVQAALASLDYAPGGIDNNYGVFTERAVRNFQRNNNITLDGVVGPSTAAALGLNPGPYAVGNGCFGGGDGGSGGGAGLSTVTADVLNIRSGPATSYPVVGELFEGTRVEVSRTSGSWSKISSSTAGEAWVSSAYLSGSATPVPPIAQPGAATVTATVLNIRSAPAMTAPVVGELFQGSRVSVIRTSGGWSEIASTSAGTAWVSSTYLSTGGTGATGIGGGGSVVSTSSGNGANVRSFPDGPRAYGLPEGAVVRLNGTIRFVNGLEWAQLIDGNWIASFVLM
ncbi:MAG: SH3 domain-containing protein, partial [Elainellaceae cyanobacterium]